MVLDSAPLDSAPLDAQAAATVVLVVPTSITAAIAHVPAFAGAQPA